MEFIISALNAAGNVILYNSVFIPITLINLQMPIFFYISIGMSSWNTYLDNLVAQSKSADGSIHTDKGCIFGLDGGAWTTTSHQYALAMSYEERADIARVFKSKNFMPFMMSGVVAAGVNYQFLRVEYDKNVYAKKNGEGAINMQASKTAIVIGHCPEGREPGNNNHAVHVIAEYLESLGM